MPPRFTDVLPVDSSVRAPTWRKYKTSAWNHSCFAQLIISEVSTLLTCKTSRTQMSFIYCQNVRICSLLDETYQRSSCVYSQIQTFLALVKNDASLSKDIKLLKFAEYPLTYNIQSELSNRPKISTQKKFKLVCTVPSPWDSSVLTWEQRFMDVYPE